MQYELLTEHDLGVKVDLILPETYERKDAHDPNHELGEYEAYIPLDPKDEKLLEEDYMDKTDVKRSKQHSLSLSWMRRPDYISTEQTRYQPATIEKIESKVGFATNRKNKNKEAAEHSANYMDREQQIAAIEKTFDDAKIPIDENTEHYSGKKPGVHPVEVFNILPDDKMWKYPCAQVIFDSDPSPGNIIAENNEATMA